MEALQQSVDAGIMILNALDKEPEDHPMLSPYCCAQSTGGSARQVRMQNFVHVVSLFW